MLNLVVRCGCGATPVGIRAACSGPQYLVFCRGSDLILIDAELGDAGWARLDATQPFVTMAGGSAPTSTQARFAYDDQVLYVAVQCGRAHVECLEVRVDADCNSEPSFAGMIVATDAAVQRDDWQRAWVASEQAWTAEIAIPWRLVTDAPRSPSPGDRWQVSIACVVTRDPLTSQSWVRPGGTGDAGFGLLEFARRSAP